MTNRKRILVGGRYFNQQGGVSNVMAQTSMRLAEDFPVTVAAHEFLDWPMGTELQRLTLPMIQRPKWAQVPSFALNALRLDRSTYAFVHSHDPQLMGADLYTAHSSIAAYLGRAREEAPLLGSWASRLYPPHVAALTMSRLAYSPPFKEHPLIVAVSKSVRAELLTHYDLRPDRVHVIYNGVDLRRFSHDGHTQADREALSAELGIDLRERPVVLFAGYEFDRKRLAVVLRGIAQVRRFKPVLIVAGGADSNAYVKLARDLQIDDFVRFLGHRSDMPRLMRASDVFAFPTKYEAASLAILEAAAAGLAIITTGLAMAAEVFEDGRDALLIENDDDPKHFARALSQILQDGTLAARLQVGAQRTARRFDWDAISAEYAALYRAILQERQDA